MAVGRTEALTAADVAGAEALVAGYRWAFVVAAGIAALGVVAALAMVRGEGGAEGER